MESKEKIKIEKNISIKKNCKDIKIDSSKKNKVFKLLLIVLIIILVIVIVIVLSYFFLKKFQRSSKNEEKFESENKNYISASYSVQSGKQVQLFSPEKIGVKDNDYTVEIIENYDNLRNLRSIDVEKGSYIPSESGDLSIKITFKLILGNLNEIFKNNKELIKVDLSNLEMKNILGMNYTFSRCLNLKQINFEGINSNSLLDMAYTFENCKNLKKLNLSPIKTGKLRMIKGIFSECYKLEIIDISSFEKVDNNLFEGIQSKPNIIANEKTSGTILNIFFNLFYIKINITIIEIQKNKTDIVKDCIIGENEKCKDCSNIFPGSCLSCNKGYYFPFNENNHTKCLSCNNTIQNCLTCFGDINYIVCSSCYSNFKLVNNKCQKNMEKKCIIGENEKCKTLRRKRRFYVQMQIL